MTMTPMGVWFCQLIVDRLYARGCKSLPLSANFRGERREDKTRAAPSDYTA